MAVLVWIAAAVLCVVVELLSLDLIFVMLAGGCAGGAIAAGAGAPLAVQLVVAAVVSVVGLAALRPAVLKRLHRSAAHTATNVDALIGRDAQVTREVTEDGGLVRIDGEVWSARSVGSKTFPVGTRVRVSGISGVVLQIGATPGDVKGGPADD